MFTTTPGTKKGKQIYGFDEFGKNEFAGTSRLITVTGAVTGNGNGADSFVRVAIIPYKRWRILDCGFMADLGFASTVAEIVHFGLNACDASVLNTSAFGILTQDATAGKNIVGGDMLSMMGNSYLTNFDAPTNAGNHVWSGGTLMNTWFTRASELLVTKKNVAGSTGTVVPWCLIEIENIKIRELQDNEW